jgi:caffeoyl-CoA O-methyltransferase
VDAPPTEEQPVFYQNLLTPFPGALSPFVGCGKERHQIQPRQWGTGGVGVLTLVPEEIEVYARGVTEPESDLLQALTQATHARTTMPQMLVGPLEGALLRLLIRLVGGTRVLEIGTFTGYSALCMAEAVPEGGQVTTLDIDPEATGIAREFWAQSPHGSKIDLRLGPAIETLAELDGPFDLVFMDADKESYVKYWDACVPKVRTGGLLVVDNVLWSGRVLNPTESSDHGIVAFNNHAKADDRVEKVLLTVRDGMLVARKK